jgi:putative glutamine amidotransferase
MQGPIVLVSACRQLIGAHAYHAAQFKYVEAVAAGAQCAPLILPALGAQTDFEAVLRAADGVMLTGSASNLHASHYGQALRDPTLPQDPARDATTLPLVRAALERGLPLLAVCRGFQEVNVALGGTLHQSVRDLPGMMDHREDHAAPLELQYAPAHPVTLTKDGRLAQILGGAASIRVNSLHCQGIAQLAPGLHAEAHADDGLVEAFSVAGAAFALGVQWHPEWRSADNPDSQRLFAAFGQACRAYRAAKR